MSIAEISVSWFKDEHMERVWMNIETSAIVFFPRLGGKGRTNFTELRDPQYFNMYHPVTCNTVTKYIYT